MTFTVDFGQQFSKEWKQYQPDQKLKVGEFVALFKLHGLVDQTKYPGRISPSWYRLPTNHPRYAYAVNNSMWHYHMGLPHYTGQQSWGKTSDWVIHFQWVGKGDHISVIDMNRHYDSRGAFYLPCATYLVPTPTPAPTGGQTP